MPTALIADPISKQHDPGWNHPESPERFDAVYRALQHQGLIDLTLPLTARLADEDDIARCHAPEYIRQARHEIECGMTQLGSGDTAVSLRSYEVARYAAGAVLRATDAVMDGSARNAFCAVRPPGHHATRDRGMGFCIFNNIALGARYAQEKYGVERVLIVDWDVHHGNGTQDIFYDDPSVFYFSAHEAPLYPFTGWAEETGTGKGVGTTMNVPLPAGAGGKELMDVLTNNLEPAMRSFRPELVMLSAGFDGRHDDPIGHWTLTDDDFKDMTAAVMRIAAEYADNRLISVLEGGYNLHGLAVAVPLHLQTLMYGPKREK